MIKYHAVMLDETGCEFGADVEAENRQEAHNKLAEDYPESRCVQLESPEDTAAREQQIHDDIDRGIERDDEGRIVYQEPGYDEGPDDEEDDEEDYEDDEG